MDRASKTKDPKPPAKDQGLTQDEKLDDALDDSFPASDPPSMTDPHKHIGNVEEDEQKAARKHS